jgi:hypothetical protein
VCSGGWSRRRRRAASGVSTARRRRRRPAAHAATRGWEAGPGVAALAIRDGRLVGRTTTAFPLLHVEWPGAAGNLDSIDSVEVRLRVSAGSTLGVDASSDEKVDLAEIVDHAKDWPWDTTAPLRPGAETRTLTLRPPRPVSAADLRHLLLRPPTSPAPTSRSSRCASSQRQEHLAAIPSGVGWQGLSQVYRETLVARSPETLRFELEVPPRALLDLGIGTPENGPVQFVVRLAAGRPRQVDGGRRAARAETLLARTVTTPHRWEPLTVDLSAHGGERVALELRLAAANRGALGFWGSPVVRQRVAAVADAPVRAANSPATAASMAPAPPPQGVILIWADTLRRDHSERLRLPARHQSPPRAAGARGRSLRPLRLASHLDQGGDPVAPRLALPDDSRRHRLHRTACRPRYTTLAEAMRGGGFATISMSSILFTGQFTNLHQGFEELHEDMSLPDRNSSKSARIYVDRLLPWLERHRDVPFFSFLHVSDAHDPYEPVPALQHAVERPRRQGRARAPEPRGAQADRDAAAQGVRDARPRRARRRRLRPRRLRRTTTAAGTTARSAAWTPRSAAWSSACASSSSTARPCSSSSATTARSSSTTAAPSRPIDLRRARQRAADRLAPRRRAGGPRRRGDGGDDRRDAHHPRRRRLPHPRRRRAPASRRCSLRRVPAAGAAGRRSPRKNLTFEPVGAPPPMDTESFAVDEEGWKLVDNTVRPRGGPELELYDTRRDPFDQHDVGGAAPGSRRPSGAAHRDWRRAGDGRRAETARGGDGEPLARRGRASEEPRLPAINDARGNL